MVVRCRSSHSSNRDPADHVASAERRDKPAVYYVCGSYNGEVSSANYWSFQHSATVSGAERGSRVS